MAEETKTPEKIVGEVAATSMVKNIESNYARRKVYAADSCAAAQDLKNTVASTGKSKGRCIHYIYSSNYNGGDGSVTTGSDKNILLNMIPDTVELLASVTDSSIPPITCNGYNKGYIRTYFKTEGQFKWSIDVTQISNMPDIKNSFKLYIDNELVISIDNAVKTTYYSNSEYKYDFAVNNNWHLLEICYEGTSFTLNTNFTKSISCFPSEDPTIVDGFPLANNDILYINTNDQLGTKYSITTSADVGNFKKGTSFDGSVKELLDLIFSTPVQITISRLTQAASSSYEKGSTIKLTEAVVNVVKGLATSLDSITIKDSSETLITTTSVIEGNNNIVIPEKSYKNNGESSIAVYAILTYNKDQTIQSTKYYNFFSYNYYGAVSADFKVADTKYNSVSNQSPNRSNLPITMNNQCALLVIAGNASMIKDENNFDVTKNFSRTTMKITNAKNYTTDYTVFKLIQPVTGTKKYTIS